MSKFEVHESYKNCLKIKVYIMESIVAEKNSEAF